MSKYHAWYKWPSFYFQVLWHSWVLNCSVSYSGILEVLIEHAFYFILFVDARFWHVYSKKWRSTPNWSSLCWVLWQYGKCMEGNHLDCWIGWFSPFCILYCFLSYFPSSLVQEKGNVDLAIRYYLIAIEVCMCLPLCC